MQPSKFGQFFQQIFVRPSTPTTSNTPVSPSLPSVSSPESSNNQSLRERLETQLRRDEGEVLSAYTDSEGYWTIGIGRLIDKRKGGGISKAESSYLFSNDLNAKSAEVYAALPWVKNLDEARQGALLNMAFQMGTNGLLGFKNTLSMIQSGKYDQAADGMLQSLWARQTPARAARLAAQMRTGVWQ